MSQSSAPRLPPANPSRTRSVRTRQLGASGSHGWSSQARSHSNSVNAISSTRPIIASRSVDLLDRLVDLIHALEEAQVGLQQRFGALARLALAQHQDAESEVGGEPLEQTHFLGGEGVALAGVDAERAEYAARFVLERQGDAGAVTALRAPRRAMARRAGRTRSPGPRRPCRSGSPRRPVRDRVRRRPR